MSDALPGWLDPRPWLRGDGPHGAAGDVETRALASRLPPSRTPSLESLAAQARTVTRRHFGRTIALYAPLYLSNHCPGGCVYCGFSSEREQPRRRLERSAIAEELAALSRMGLQEVLLLTGDRTPDADFGYLRMAVAMAAERFHRVTVESFAMTLGEYRDLVAAGCTGVTIYQETYDPDLYQALHRWGPKRDYGFRLEAPARALEAGMRTVGLGVLFGLGEPRFDALALFRHVRRLQRQYWSGGVTVSFPRFRPHCGGYVPEHPVGDRELARTVYAFRLALPETPLVLSTRERPAIRDGLAGVGISKMSVASRTTVGGYGASAAETGGQFDVEDRRGVLEFTAALRRMGLDPVFKEWDAVFTM